MTDVSDAIDNESALASERAAARLHPEAVPEGGVYSPTLLLYYKADSGFGAIGRVTDTNNHSTLHTFPAGAFATDWTHIVQSAYRILYYNAVTGLGAIGRVTDKYDHETLRTFPAGAFAKIPSARRAARRRAGSADPPRRIGMRVEGIGRTASVGSS